MSWRAWRKGQSGGRWEGLGRGEEGMRRAGLQAAGRDFHPKSNREPLRFPAGQRGSVI